MKNVLDEINGHSFQEFQSSLADAKEWCSDTGHRLTEAPQLLRTYGIQPWLLAATRKDIVGSVIRNRNGALAGLKPERDAFRAKYNWRPPKNYQQGRLLIYRPDDNVVDGAAKVETYGFFDIECVPPWDTWVAYIQENPRTNYLVCWVPEVFVPLANAGVEVDPMECLQWLETSDCALKRLLEQGR